mmetsp:Transcript_6268/g.15592  ORF Transcript_6268/g.15592 Transcript_6268/m.15592 type:complete len:83 (-) Transcript_6268:30-278(-)
MSILWNGKSMYQLLIGSKSREMDMSWLCLQGISEEDVDINNHEDKNQKGRWLRRTKEKAAQSETATYLFTSVLLGVISTCRN